MTKISIIIPVYNVDKYLSRCLDSVIAQTYKNFEAICVNDGSTDNSLSILNKYAKKDSRIKIITQQNKGPSETRNTGLKKAIGEYICFIDSDDFVHSQYLEILLKNANKNTISKCFFLNFSNNTNIENFKITDIKKNIFQANTYYEKTKDINLTAWGKLYHKEIISDIYFNNKCFFSEDVLFNADVLTSKINIAELSVPLYYYFQNPLSLIHKKSSIKKIMSLLLVAEELSQKFSNNKHIYKNRISKALSNALKYIKDCEDLNGLENIVYPKIQYLKQKKIIFYRGLSFSKKYQLLKILFLRRI